MAPEKMSGEFSPEQSNQQEKLKSVIEEALLHALSTEQTENKKDFFERFLSRFNQSDIDGIGEEYKSKYNDLLNLRHNIEIIEEDLESGACETKKEAIEKFFDDQTVKESLGL